MKFKKYKIHCKNRIHGEKEVDFIVNVSKNSHRMLQKTVDGKIDTSIILTPAYHRMYCFYQGRTMYYDLKTIPDKLKVKSDNWTIEGLFSSCWSLEKVDLSELATQNITDMSCLFESCNRINSIKFGGKFNTKNTRNMTSMLRNTWSLRRVDLSCFNTSMVTQMGSMFESSGVSELDLSSFDTRSVENMWGMFRFAENLTTLKLNFNMQNVTSANAMFEGTKNIKNGDIRFYNVPRSKWADRAAFMQATMLDKCPIADKVVVEFKD